MLAALKISPSCYLQAQVSEWIPLGGDEEHSGAILHYHFSLNKECYKSPGLRFIGTLEANGYSFQVEILFQCLRAGWKLQEVPISFVDRQLGRTKMSRREVYQAIPALLRMAWLRLTG